MGSTAPESNSRPLARLDSASGRWLDSSPCADDLFSEQSPSLLERWPSSGMTRNGILYQLPKSGPHTDANGSSLLPTPRATDGTKGGPNQRGSSGDLMLPSAVCQLLPTPRAMDAHGSMVAPASRKHVEDGNGSLPEVLGAHLDL